MLVEKQVAIALLNKGDVLYKAGKTDSALAAFDGVISRFGNAYEEELKKLVADARQYRSIVLDKAGKK
ncbi:MAG: hypothetical protein WAW02_11520 [Sideroxyarcus sp.]